MFSSHDDVIKWKHFPRYWPFVRGIHGHRGSPRTKASDAELCLFSMICACRNGWVYISGHRWFETPPRSLWRHCNGPSFASYQSWFLVTLLWSDDVIIMADDIWINLTTLWLLIRCSKTVISKSNISEGSWIESQICNTMQCLSSR